MLLHLTAPSHFALRLRLLAGESYAGVYVPMLAQAILALPNAGGLNLKGILVGNGAAATGGGQSIR